MDLALSILGWTTFGLLIIVGLALNLLGLFGNWIILAAMGGLWALTGFEHFGWLGLTGMVAQAVLGEFLKTAASGYGASRFGGSRGSIVAALGDRPKKSERRNETEAEKRKPTQETGS
jgi:hypothetical protein